MISSISFGWLLKVKGKKSDNLVTCSLTVMQYPHITMYKEVEKSTIFQPIRLSSLLWVWLHAELQKDKYCFGSSFGDTGPFLTNALV